MRRDPLWLEGRLGGRGRDDANTVTWGTFKLKKMDKMKLRLTKTYIAVYNGHRKTFTGKFDPQFNHHY